MNFSGVLSRAFLLFFVIFVIFLSFFLFRTPFLFCLGPASTVSWHNEAPTQLKQHCSPPVENEKTSSSHEALLRNPLGAAGAAIINTQRFKPELPPLCKYINLIVLLQPFFFTHFFNWARFRPSWGFWGQDLGEVTLSSFKVLRTLKCSSCMFIIRRGARLQLEESVLARLSLRLSGEDVIGRWHAAALPPSLGRICLLPLSSAVDRGRSDWQHDG